MADGNTRRLARRLAGRAGASCMRGMAALGVMFGLVPVKYFEAMQPEPEADPPPLGGPPAGHPERLTPQVPLSPRERELWKQLDGLGKSR